MPCVLVCYFLDVLGHGKLKLMLASGGQSRQTADANFFNLPTVYNTTMPCFSVKFASLWFQFTELFSIYHSSNLMFASGWFQFTWFFNLPQLWNKFPVRFNTIYLHHWDTSLRPNDFDLSQLWLIEFASGLFQFTALEMKFASGTFQFTTSLNYETRVRLILIYRSSDL